MRSIELFAGCGGLAFGIAKAGFHHELVIEQDADCIRTLMENKRQRVKHVKDWHILQCQTQAVNFKEYCGIDLISGGPPCQPFSIGGKHLGQKDGRNMWPEAVRAIREARPKSFVFENVRGLLRPAFENYLDYIRLQLGYPDLQRRSGEQWRTHLKRLQLHSQKRTSEPEYLIKIWGANLADYGAPQRRHRTIVMGLRSDKVVKFASPSETHSHESLLWSKFIEGDYWKRHAVRKRSESEAESYALKRAIAKDERPKLMPWMTVRDAISDLPNPSRREPIQGHWQHPGAKTYTNHTGSCMDEPAKALKAGDHGVPGGENMLVNGRGNVRYFTVREMARLQCFPDDFVITGSWKAATRQLGNAVPTVLGHHIGKSIRKIIAG